MRFRAGRKACAFALGAAVLGGSAYWAWHTYDSFNTAQENELLLENIEALAVGEDIKLTKYKVFHEKCVNEDGIETGKYFAWCYKSPTGDSHTCHQHSCNDCKSL